MSATPSATAAQVSGSASIATDVRLRGISLNGGRPAFTVGLAYDHPSGVYAGAAATAGDTRRFGAQFLQRTLNLGYAARLSSGLAWEAGVLDTRVKSNVFRRFTGIYREAYAGLNAEHFSGRIFFAPRFVQPGNAAAYVDLNGNVPLSTHVRAFGHVGFWIPVGERNDAVLPRARADFRVGTAIVLQRTEFQLAWVRSGAGSAFLAPRLQDADALIFTATRNF